MKPVHPLLKIATLLFFFLVVIGFVSYRAGAFEDEQNKMPETNYALQIKSRQTQASASPALVQTDPMRMALEEKSQQMMFSSKSMILAEPAGISMTMMSSSKSSTVFVPDQPTLWSPLAGAMFAVPKTDDRPVIKQKK